MKTIVAVATLCALLVIPSLAQNQAPVVRPTKSADFQGFTVVVDSTDNERWIDHSIVAGMTDRVIGAENTAKAALDSANTALANDSSTYGKVIEVDEKASKALAKASNVDFAGKTIARELRTRAMEYMIWLAGDSTSSVTIKNLGAKLATSKKPKLSGDEETLIATLYLEYLESGARLAATPAPDITALVDSLVNAKLSDIDQKIDAMAATDSTLADMDSALQFNIRQVAHNTATALGARDPDTNEKASRQSRDESIVWLANYGR